MSSSRVPDIERHRSERKRRSLLLSLFLYSMSSFKGSRSSSSCSVFVSWKTVLGVDHFRDIVRAGRIDCFGVAALDAFCFVPFVPSFSAFWVDFTLPIFGDLRDEVDAFGSTSDNGRLARGIFEYRRRISFFGTGRLWQEGGTAESGCGG